MHAELQALKKSPRLPEIVQNLQAFLDDERRRRREFYDQISEANKAEFINGESLFHSPVRKKHLGASGRLVRLLDIYTAIHRLGQVFVEKAMIELTRNSYEPDVCFLSGNAPPNSTTIRWFSPRRISSWRLFRRAPKSTTGA